MFSVVWLELDAEYPSAGSLYLDGHYASIVVRLDAEPMIIQDCFVSDSSSAPFLFSPLVVTGAKAFLLPA
jgi:hypothetical protein